MWVEVSRDSAEKGGGIRNFDFSKVSKLTGVEKY